MICRILILFAHLWQGGDLSKIESDPMTLLEFLKVYAAQAILRQSSLDSYRFAITAFHRVHPNFKIQDFSVDVVNYWIQAELARGQSPFTVRSDRSAICTLWRAAAEREMAPTYKRPLLVKCPRKIVRGHSPTVIGKL